MLKRTTLRMKRQELELSGSILACLLVVIAGVVVQSRSRGKIYTNDHIHDSGGSGKECAHNLTVATIFYLHTPILSSLARVLRCSCIHRF